MATRTSSHIVKGMNKDISKSKFSSDFAYDARNIRITAREGETLLTVTNEKGNKDVLYLGDKLTTPLGCCVLGNYLILFGKYGYDDRIYKINTLDYSYTLLSTVDLGFSEDYKIETLGVYESENIQKVYWVDGKNQPRVINIANNTTNSSNNTLYDFVQKLSLNEDISITRSATSSGMFSPGTIQYAFTYYNKYGQESNIFHTTHLMYISHSNRGASPEDKVSCSFNIHVTDIDTNFEFLRIYSIHRTSLDSTPIVKRVTDIELSGTTVNYVDNGTVGIDVDPTQLLYIGGEDIIAGTIAQKDNTLFLGNIEIKRPSISSSIKKNIKGSTVTSSYRTVNLQKDTNSGYYSYNSGLCFNTAGFKAREHYRLGVQFQHESGKWSEPILIGTATSSNTPYQKENSDGSITLYIPTMSSVINTSGLRGSEYIRARAVVVFPSMQDRKVVVQGMLCPTVFNFNNRKNNTPFAQSSWFIRPNLPWEVNFSNSNMDNNQNIDKGAWVEFRHWYGLFNGGTRGAEIQNISAPSNNQYNISMVNSPDYYGDVFMVDQSIVTMHSPDIEFDDNIKTIDGENFNLRIVGVIKFNSSVGDIDIQTSSPTAYYKATGFDHRTVGNYSSDGTTSNQHAARGLVSGLFYRDWAIDDKKNNEYGYYDKQEYEVGYLVYPWQKTGSLNNDIERPDGKGARTSVLKKKVISNLKFSKDTTWLGSAWEALSSDARHNGITQVQLFNSNEMSLVKIPSPKNSKMTAINYYGNVDTLLSTRAEYSTFIGGDLSKGGSFYSSIDTLENKHIGDYTDLLTTKKDPVRMKYKSTPHLVFSLNYSENSGSPLILPTLGTNRISMSAVPFWLKEIVSQDVIEGNKYRELKYVNTNTTEYWNPSLDWGVGDLLFGASENKLYTCYYNINMGSGTLKDHFREVVITTDDEGAKYRYKSSTGTVSYFEVTYMDPLGKWGLKKTYEGSSGSNDSTFSVVQDTISSVTSSQPYLFMAELYRSNVENAFGGDDDYALKENLWIPAGPVVRIGQSTTTIQFYYGDTWYQRYDCLKTYAFSKEDENQVVEIASFMCETRVNIDGRYDRNRGQLSNLNMSPTNFNLLNPVYSQKDNFFNYRILDKDYYSLNKFPTTITWSKEKTLSEEIDTWTNVTMANTLILDGDKGKINALRTFNNEIFCFQDKGISNILFNSRVQIPSSDGVPIEISNGYKVNGKRYISNTIGCQNKWSIAESPNGLYFLDENSNGLYLFNGQLDNISTKNGMEVWVRDNKHDWYGSFYDKNIGDVYFTTGKESLVYSEKLGAFTSFMSYEATNFMTNVGDSFYAIRNSALRALYLWKQFAGDYNSFYGSKKPYSITVISNQDMPHDKIFNNIEFRADSWQGNTLLDSTFDRLEVWNEYQSGSTNLYSTKDKPSSLKRKFRVWRANIPRDSKNKRDRIRNPWAYIKLEKSNPSTERTELHDIMVHYFI